MKPSIVETLLLLSLKHLTSGGTQTGVVLSRLCNLLESSSILLNLKV